MSLRPQMSDLAYLSLGSNLGNRKSNLEHAIQRLGSVGTVQRVSSLYETAPVEVIDQPQFLNCVVALETALSPIKLMEQLLAIEQSMGRKRIHNKGPRTIDLDILLFADKVVNTRELTVPHPALHQRRFVLEPLAEIAPEARHPLLKKTAQELLKELGEGQSVHRIGEMANDQRRTTSDGSTEE